MRAMCSLSTRFTGWAGSLKNTSIRRWKTTRSTSSWVRDRQRAPSIRLDLPRFTLIGATTRPGLITGPMRSRFGIIEHLEYYTHDELAQGLARDAKLLGFKLDDDAAYELGARSRGTMRIAKRLLRRVRDFAEVAGEETIGLPRARQALYGPQHRHARPRGP